MEHKQSGQSCIILSLIAVIILLLCCCCLAAGFFYLGSSERLPAELQNEFDQSDLTWNYDSNSSIYYPEPTIEPFIPTPQTYETPGDSIIMDPDAEFELTPVGTVYKYLSDNLKSDYGSSISIAPPILSQEKIEMTFTYDGVTDTYWIVEKTNTGSYAEVVVGPPNAGGTLYTLESTGAVWAITDVIDEGF